MIITRNDLIDWICEAPVENQGNEAGLSRQFDFGSYSRPFVVNERTVGQLYRDIVAFFHEQGRVKDDHAILIVPPWFELRVHDYCDGLLFDTDGGDPDTLYGVKTYYASILPYTKQSDGERVFYNCVAVNNWLKNASEFERTGKINKKEALPILITPDE